MLRPPLMTHWAVALRNAVRERAALDKLEEQEQARIAQRATLLDGIAEPPSAEVFEHALPSFAAHDGDDGDSDSGADRRVAAGGCVPRLVALALSAVAEHLCIYCQTAENAQLIAMLPADIKELLLASASARQLQRVRAHYALVTAPVLGVLAADTTVTRAVVACTALDHEALGVMFPPSVAALRPDPDADGHEGGGRGHRGEGDDCVVDTWEDAADSLGCREGGPADPATLSAFARAAAEAAASPGRRGESAAADDPAEAASGPDAAPAVRALESREVAAPQQRRPPSDQAPIAEPPASPGVGSTSPASAAPACDARTVAAAGDPDDQPSPIYARPSRRSRPRARRAAGPPARGACAARAPASEAGEAAASPTSPACAAGGDTPRAPETQASRPRPRSRRAPPVLASPAADATEAEASLSAAELADLFMTNAEARKVMGGAWARARRRPAAVADARDGASAPSRHPTRAGAACTDTSTRAGPAARGGSHSGVAERARGPAGSALALRLRTTLSPPAALPGCVALRSLTLVDAPWLSGAWLGRVARALPTLRELRLRGCLSGPGEGALALAAVARWLTLLRVLDLSRNAWLDERALVGFIEELRRAEDEAAAATPRGAKVQASSRPGLGAAAAAAAGGGGRDDARSRLLSQLRLPRGDGAFDGASGPAPEATDPLLARSGPRAFAAFWQPEAGPWRALDTLGLTRTPVATALQLGGMPIVVVPGVRDPELWQGIDDEPNLRACVHAPSACTRTLLGQVLHGALPALTWLE